MEYILSILFIFLQSFLVIFAVLMMAYLGIYGERKLWAAVQLRRGPNIVGPFGLLQPVADFLKLLLKEPIIPENGSITLSDRPGLGLEYDEKELKKVITI